MIASWLQALIMAFLLSTVFYKKGQFPLLYEDYFNPDEQPPNFKEVTK